MNIHVRNVYECHPASRETTRRCAMTAEPEPHPPSRSCRRSAPPMLNGAGRRHGRDATAPARPGSGRGGQIVTKAFSTDGVRPAEREAFWRHALSGLLPVTITILGKGTVEGSVQLHRAGRMVVAEGKATSQDIRRTAHDISQSQPEYFQLAVVANGGCRSARTTGKLNPTRATGPPTTASGPSSCCSIATGTHAPSRSARNSPPERQRTTAYDRAANGWQDRHDRCRVAVPARPRAHQRRCASTAVGASAAAGQRPRRELAQRLRRPQRGGAQMPAADGHAEDQGLHRPAAVRPRPASARDRRRGPHLRPLPAQALRGHRSVSQYIKGLRLERSRHELLDPRLASRSIAAVAFACGFGDLSGFNRAFKDAYRTSPRQLRTASP